MADAELFVLSKVLRLDGALLTALFPALPPMTLSKGLLSYL